MLQRYTSKSGSYFVLTQRFFELENASIFCHILRYLAQNHLEAIFAYVNPKKNIQSTILHSDFSLSLQPNSNGGVR